MTGETDKWQKTIGKKIRMNSTHNQSADTIENR